jgi:hypothetical protein
MAIVRVDAETQKIMEYKIQHNCEEASFTSISPRIIMIMFSISAAMYAALYFAFKMLGL